MALLLPASIELGAQAAKTERVVDSQRPLQTDLLVPLDPAKLKIGTPVFTKARADWHNASCHVSSGSTVTGHIVAVEPHSRQSKGSSLTILFDTVDCNDHPSHMLFSLFAVIVETVREEDAALADYGVFGAASIQSHMGGGAVPSALQVLGQSQQTSVRSSSTSSLHLPSVLRSGQVLGQKNLLLSVGDGLEGGSVLSSSKGNLHIGVGAQFVLMPRVFSPPEMAKTTDSVSSLPSSNATVPPSPKGTPSISTIEKEPDTTEICSSSCTVASLIDSFGSYPSPNSALSTVPLGYVPREGGKHVGFNHEATLTYIDAANLLFAFDSHKLGHRLQNGFRTQSMKTVRAVLLNPANHQIHRILEWQVPNTGQYVWPLGKGRILVHLGQKLCLLNSHLDSIRELSLTGELAFVSVSPFGSHVVVGVVHELHTHEVHEYLTATQQVEPEEDVDLQLLDDNLELLLASHQSSHLPQVVLLESGEVRTLPLGHHRWRVNEYPWDGKPRRLIDFRSDCSPDLSSTLPGDLFIVGCDSSPLQNWYRMVRSDGTSVLVGHGSSREIDQVSQAVNDQEFAVRVVQAEGTQGYNDSFFKSDLQRQQVAVYRSSDGKQIFEATASPTLVEQSFALSPSGDQLAILTNGGISFYALPPFPR